MSAAICRTLHAAGLTARAEGGALVIAPAELLTDAMRTTIRDHKAELMDFLTAAPTVTARLIRAAMRACDQHSDGPAARETMLQDCIATPVHLQADLLSHFETAYS